jgi:Ca2+-binding RTX toxin-like protein
MARHEKHNDAQQSVALATAGDDDIRPGVGIEWNLPNLVDAGAGNDTVMGGKFADTIMGGDGDDFVDGMGGADLITLGAGADTVKIHSWAYSLDVEGERDTVTDFEAADKIDMQNVSHYFDSDADGVVDAARDLTWADITLEPIAGGNILHASVWEGDARWDVGMVLLGETPTADNMVF